MTDIERAKDLFEKGKRCCLGKEVPEKALRLFEKAAELGSPEAKYALGVCYYNGKGVPVDLRMAASLFLEAAMQQNAEAQFALANCYFKGHGVPRDSKTAECWLYMAAGQGNAEALKMLEEMNRKVVMEVERNEYRKLFTNPKINPFDIRKARAPYVVLDLNTYALREEENGPMEDPAILNGRKCRTTELWFRRVKPGTFTMGLPKEELDPWDSNLQHKVTLTEPYYIGVFPITQYQYQMITGSDPFEAEDIPNYYKNDLADQKGEEQPAKQVSFDMIRGISRGTMWPLNYDVDHSSFLGQLRQRSGLLFDLPTEAMWEMACKAGAEKICGQINGQADGENRLVREEPQHKSKETAKNRVGSGQPNDWGIFDMCEKFWEWCLDWFDYSPKAAATDPKGPDSGYYRMLCSGIHKNHEYPYHKDAYSGFRLVLLPFDLKTDAKPRKLEKRDFKALMDIDSSKAKYLVLDILTYEMREEEKGPAEDPSIFNNEAWRTFELWFRRIEPNEAFAAEGSPAKPFYIGVNKVSQTHFALLTGSNPSLYKGDLRPVESVTFDMLRGPRKGDGFPYSTDVDEDSVIGFLRDKTTLMFDLPTEAQREYACRFEGKEFSPNRWGLYEIADIYLNRTIKKSDWCSFGYTPRYYYTPLEWCLDVYSGKDLFSSKKSAKTEHVLRGEKTQRDHIPSDYPWPAAGIRLVINF